MDLRQQFNKVQGSDISSFWYHLWTLFFVAPAKKRGRAALPKEPKAPKPPKVPKAPKPPKPPKEPKAPKPPKDPNAPKAKPGPKPKKAAEAQADGKQEKIDESFKKVKRKIDRFKGMSEEEVMKKTLPDLLDYNLDYVIVRIICFYSGTQHCAICNEFDFVRFKNMCCFPFRLVSIQDWWQLTLDGGFQVLEIIFVSYVTSINLSCVMVENGSRWKIVLIL